VAHERHIPGREAVDDEAADDLGRLPRFVRAAAWPSTSVGTRSRSRLVAVAAFRPRSERSKLLEGR
jgi:hypothetical protein